MSPTGIAGAARARRIILDTDLSMGEPGSEIDDGFALALAVADPALRLELITSVAGNTDVDTATLLIHELLDRIHLAGIPVARGAAGPILRPDLARRPPTAVRERWEARRRHPDREIPIAEPAAVALARLVMANPGEITVVAIGPLTNIALAIALEPGVAQAAREIVIMGGMFLGQTQQRAMPGEFNVWADPEAAHIVLHSEARLRWVGLDVTQQVRLTRQVAHRLRGRDEDDGFATFAAHATLQWIERQSERHPGDAAHADSCPMHDPLAVAAVNHPELITWRPAHVSVATGDGVARGVTLADLLTSVDAPEANCMIASDVDADAFLEHFLRSISALR
jgi:purine nucleosidase